MFSNAFFTALQLDFVSEFSICTRKINAVHRTSRKIKGDNAM